MTHTRQVRLTGRAARLLQMIQDLGHLDEQGTDEVLLQLQTGFVHCNVETADASDVRRAAAKVLFDRAGADGVDGILAEDWPLLFS